MIRFFIKVISKPFEWLLPDFFKIQEPPLLVSLINKLSNDFSWLGEPQRDEFVAFIDSMKSSNGASVKRCLVIKAEKQNVWDNILNFLLKNVFECSSTIVLRPGATIKVQKDTLEANISFVNSLSQSDFDSFISDDRKNVIIFCGKFSPDFDRIPESVDLRQMNIKEYCDQSVCCSCLTHNSSADTSPLNAIHSVQMRPILAFTNPTSRLSGRYCYTSSTFILGSPSFADYQNNPASLKEPF